MTRFISCSDDEDCSRYTASYLCVFRLKLLRVTVHLMLVTMYANWYCISLALLQVMLYMEERRERIIDFVSNLFGIVGGVITVLSLFEGLLHQSAKTLIGKND